MRDWGICRPSAWHAAGVTDTGRMQREGDLGRDLGEGPRGEAAYGPPRFFSFRSDEKVRAALGRHGDLERWETSGTASDLHYQFAILRTP
jgi:hypothetical protein